MSSISSLRPYAQSRAAVKPKVSKPSMRNMIGQQMAPWPAPVHGLPPLKESSSSSVSMAATPPSSTFRPTHKRTLTPAPEPEPEPLYQTLCPAKVRVPSGTLKASFSSLSSEKRDDNNVHPTFGSRSSSRAGSKGSMEEYSGGSLTPVFKRIHDHERKRSALIPTEDFSRRGGGASGSRGSQTSELSDEFSLPIARETRRVLGMSGTMGGSDVSCYQGPDPDVSDPDSDVALFPR
jgi:serine/arginine repetitive matrix protein 2